MASVEAMDDLEDIIVEFCRLARASGFNAGVKETLDALESATLVGAADRSAFKFALRAVLCSSKEEWERFEQIFEEFWSSRAHSRCAEPSVKSHSASNDAGGGDEARNVRHASLNSSLGSDATTLQEGKSVSGASVLERIGKTDFSLVPQGDLRALERLAQRLLEQMCLRLSRRLRVEQRGRVDLRKTIRASIGSGGEPVDLRFRGHSRQQPRLVSLIDVSGSMELYSMFLLRFAFALHKHFREARTFIFSTGPIEVTEPLSARRLDKAFEMLGGMPAGWSGGTRIGESLAQINRGGPRLLSRNTLFIIFSDGLDTGDPTRLGAEMRAIKRRVRKVVWLNPLAGMDNYRPLARGMSAALPYVDCFAAANSLKSLLQIEKILGSRMLR